MLVRKNNFTFLSDEGLKRRSTSLRGGTTKQSRTKTDCFAIARNDVGISVRAPAYRRGRKLRTILVLFLLTFFSCKNSGEKELTDEEKLAADSISKVVQKTKADSLKRLNPLLIMPPDSLYTGDYTDKYETGVVKFKGFFRFGKRHGQWRSFYPNGILWSELHFDKGNREGLNITYFESGKKRYEGFYRKDLQDSIWLYYDSTGITVQKVLYKNDRVVQRLPLN